jgi:dTDP-4-dehydrorhamnose 3,5-epimerase
VRRIETRLEGPVLVQPDLHGDARGFFQETYRKAVFGEFGLYDEFVQDNHSRSGRGVLRGMHFQPGQAKLIRCARGAVFDAIVDIRPGSPAFGRWEGFRLDDERHLELYVPDGFAHGFCVLSDVADVIYKVSSYYDPAVESGFRFDDPDVGIAWPADLDLKVSDRDRAAPRLQDLSLDA